MKAPALFATTLLSLAPAISTAASVFVNEINTGGATVAGDWFELVVVGDDSAGSTVDMRGWTIRVDNNGETNAGRFTLSNDNYWSNVQAGTILTFHEDNAAGGGVDTGIHLTNNFTTLGWAHTNIWVGDASYVNIGAIDYDGGFPIDNNDSQVVILDGSLSVVFGPAGENHVGYTGGGVNATEVFKLEANPSTSVTLNSPYNDGTSSTFGAPNEWGAGTITQDFAPFVVPEPSVLLLGVVGLLGFTRRRR